MYKSVPFEFFEANQTIYFSISRLRELEKLMNTSVIKLVKDIEIMDFSFDLILSGLFVGLKHHYPRATAAFYEQKLYECFDKGFSPGDIAAPIVKAIFLSGIFGKDLVKRIEHPEMFADETKENEAKEEAATFPEQS